MDRYLVEYDSERAGSFEPLRFVPKGKTVVLGLVTTKERQLEIQLRVAGDSREQALELVRRMEQSERFRRPQLRSETSPADAPEKVQFEIVALYLPVPAAGVTR